MRLGDLIEQLQDIAEERGDEIDVRLAIQPSWPMQYEIGSVEVVNLKADEDEQTTTPPSDEDREDVVYLTEKNQIGYLPEVAAQVIGWR